MQQHAKIKIDLEWFFLKMLYSTNHAEDSLIFSVNTLIVSRYLLKKISTKLRRQHLIWDIYVI